MKAIHIVCIALLTVILVKDVSAHPPNEVELSFDLETSTLKVSVSHMVAKITRHYIDKITVELNGEEIITQKFKVQGSGEKQEVSYTIPGAELGDTFTVTAYCNISGKRKKSLELEQELPGAEDK